METRDRPEKVEEGKIVLEKMEVTGSRIRSILGEQGVNPVMTFTRAEIEQSGVTSLVDLRALVPQLSVGNTNQFAGISSGSTGEARLNFNLRGITGPNTLILVDGRRLPRTAQRNAASENFELTGVPLSAIERVEILLDGGGAVYGADAVGGVINIITRKNYSGSEVEFSYDNTFDKDAAKVSGAFRTGIRRGPFSLRVSVFHETQNALARRDRWWLASDDLRPLGGTDNRSNNFAVGVVRAPTGTLPGTNGATVLRIPVGADGKHSTIADFVAAGAPTDADRFDAGKVQNAMNRSARLGFTGGVEYHYRPWLNAYADYSFSRYRGYGDPGAVFLGTLSSTNALVNSVLPATYAGNPFGVPVNVQKYVWEIDAAHHYDFTNSAITLGVQGDLKGDWRYHGAIGYVKSESSSEPTVQFGQTQLATAMQSANPPTLLNDSLGYGAANPPGTLEALLLPGDNIETDQVWSYDVGVDGPIFEWRAGKIATAIGAEMREEYIDFHRPGAGPSTEAADPTGPRTIKSAFAELSVPVVGAGNKLPFLRELNLSLAGRSDHYSDFGSATKPRYGASLRPFSWMLLRATRGETYRVPTLGDLNRPTLTSNATFAATGSFVLFDTVRNEQLLGTVANTTGGNPDLMPEEAVTKNYGVVVDVPGRWFKGLSFSVDHWEIDMTNRVGSVTIQDRFTFRPDLFTRGAPTAADIAAGIPGRIIALDGRSINIGLFRTAGNDFSLRYNRRTKTLGNFSLRAMVTDTTRYESITRPGLAPVTSQSTLLRPLRGTAMLDWNRGALNLGVTSTYQEGFRSTATSAASETPATTLWDLRGMFDFDKAGWHPGNRWAARALKGVRINVAILNALNLEPPLNSTGSTTGAVNALGRRYTFTLRKAF